MRLRSRSHRRGSSPRSSRSRELSAVEVMRAFLAQIERVNPHVNAIVTLRPPEELLAEAAAADRKLAAGELAGPLHGLPIAIKDLSLTRGLRTTFGSTLYRDFVPTSDELYVDAAAPRRRHRHRQDEHAGVRRGLADVQRAVRRDAQPVRPDEDLRRQQRRRGRRARLRHAAARRRHRSRRLAAQSRELLQRRRLQAVAGARAATQCARRRHARRARPDGAQRRRSRAAAVRHGRPRRARSAVAARTWQRVSQRRGSAISPARESPGASASDAIPSSPPSRRSVTPRVPCSSTLGCDVVDAEPDLERRRRAIPNVAGGRLRGGARPRSRQAARQAQGHRRLEHRAGAQTDGRGSRARREPASGARLRASAQFFSSARFPRAADGAGAAVPVEIEWVRAIEGVPMHTYVDWMATLLRDQLLGRAGDQRAVRVFACGLAGRVADRGPPRPRSRGAGARAGVRAGDAVCSASPTARRGSVGRSCAPTICRRRRSATIFTSGSKASRKYVLPVCSVRSRSQNIAKYWR